MKNKLVYFLLIIISICLLAFLYGPIFLQPNAFLFAGTNDGLKIYFDTIWHTKYGEGLYSNAYNYPVGEVLPLSGGQAFLSWVLSYINHYWFSISKYTVGIINTLSFVLIVVSTIISYKLLLRLKINYAIAICGAILITFFPPLIWRVIGHTNLGFPFFIPLVLLWALNVYENKKPLFFSLMLGLLLIVLGFNNGYFIIFGSIFLFVCAMAMLIVFKKKQGLSLLLCASIGLLSNFLILKKLDHISDRVKVPYGFLENKTNWQGFLKASCGETKTWPNIINEQPGLNLESYNYLGYVSMPLIFIAIVLLFVYRKLIFKKAQETTFSFLVSIAISAIVLALIGSGFWYQNNQEFCNKYLYPFLQFRASGRFGWPLVVVSVILNVSILNFIYLKISNKILAIIVILIPLVIYFLELGAHLNQFVYKGQGVKGENIFAEQNLNSINWPSNKYNITPDSCQALYILPMVSMWTDKLNFDAMLNSNTIMASYQLGYKFHLPHISSQLSRMSYGQTLKQVQLCSNSLIDKEIVKQLPNNKYILLVCHKGDRLRNGEAALKASATYLFTMPETEMMVYAYRPQLADEGYKLTCIDSINNKKTSSRFECKDDEAILNANAIFNKGYFNFNADSAQLIFEANFNKFNVNDNLVFSFWTKTTNELSGNAWVELQILDSAGKQILGGQASVFESEDNYKGWVRSEIPIWHIQKGWHIRVNACNSKALFDSYLLKRQSENVGFKINANTYFYNNYFINSPSK
jgi:Co/Zn/Cd efflux system component